jgi:AraC-like DNA-binding protein
MAAAMVRAQALSGYRQLVAELGGDSVRLLRRAGIRVGALDELTSLINFEAVIDLLEDSAAVLECPDFGLRLADRQEIGIFGTLAVAMRNAATVGDALRCASKYLDVHNRAVSFTINRSARAGRVRLDLQLSRGDGRPWVQAAEHGIGIGWRTVTTLCEGHARLRGVWFPHRPAGSEVGYRSRFPAPLTFEARQAALALDIADLNRPISGNNRGLRDAATQYLSTHTRRPQRSWRARVRQVIEPLLGTGTCNCQQVASALHMHPRTLQRRLREEDTSFEQIKDEARRDLARRYLAHPDVPLTQVTALLDYAEQSAFSRSVQRWFHTTPRNLRNRLTAHADLASPA